MHRKIDKTLSKVFYIFVNTLPPFIELHQLDSCERGDCMMCGRCCVAFNVEVPSIPGDAFSTKIFKAAGIPCPQLVTLPDGRYGCAVHEQKEKAGLKDCAEWNGTGGEYYRMRENMLEAVFNPQTVEQAKIIVQLHDQGFLEDMNLLIQNKPDLYGALGYVTLLDELPHTLFQAMQLREFMASCLEYSRDQLLEILGHFGMHGERQSSDPRVQLFVEMYITPIIGS